MAGVNVSIGADSKKAERELSNFERKTKRIAKSIQKGFQERIGHKLFDGLAKAARAVPGFLNSAIQSASALNEEISKSETIFGSSAGEIRSWAQGAAEAMGMSEVAAMEASGTIGNMFQAMGMSGKEAARMSKNMVELAADLGSFNNTTTEDAIQAIGAALRGESEPIRRYGVLLDDATLKAEALNQGLYEGTGTLKPASRALSAYSVILKQTTAAQGDFQKTSDGLANSQKILNAQLAGGKTQIGKELLPTMRKLIEYLREADWKETAEGISDIGSAIAWASRNAAKGYITLKRWNEKLEEAAGIIKSKDGVSDETARAIEQQDREQFGESLEEGKRRLSRELEEDSLNLYGKLTEEVNELIVSQRKAAEAAKNAGDQAKESAKSAAKANSDERESVFQLIQKYKELTEEKMKSIRADIESNRKDALQSISMREAETLAEFGMGQAAITANRVQELMRMGLGEGESRGIADREADIERLFRTRDLLSNLSSRSSNLAVSSMQRVGGGGGVSSTLDIQKRQATLQAQMVDLLKEIRTRQAPALSDF